MNKNNILDAISKLNETQSLVKGIRLGISVASSVSQPMQNIEGILKLVIADLQEISNILSNSMDNNIEEKQEESVNESPSTIINENNQKENQQTVENVSPIQPINNTQQTENNQQTKSENTENLGLENGNN